MRALPAVATPRAAADTGSSFVADAHPSPLESRTTHTLSLPSCARDLLSSRSTPTSLFLLAHLFFSLDDGGCLDFCCSAQGQHRHRVRVRAYCSADSRHRIRVRASSLLFLGIDLRLTLPCSQCCHRWRWSCRLHGRPLPDDLRLQGPAHRQPPGDDSGWSRRVSLTCLEHERSWCQKLMPHCLSTLCSGIQPRTLEVSRG